MSHLKAPAERLDSFVEIIEAARQEPASRVVVAAPEHAEVLNALAAAADLGIAIPVLVGSEQEIRQVAEEQGIDVRNWRILDVADRREVSTVAAATVGRGEGDILMKGLVQTADLLRAALRRDTGLRRGLASHVWVTELPEGRLLLIADAGIVIHPTLEEKVQIVKNTVAVAHALGIDRPKVAVLAAMEQVNPRIQSTTDAANLAKMGDRMQIRGAVIDGPVTLDMALSPAEAAIREYSSPVGGDADILIVPHIEAGNVLVKSLVYFNHSPSAGIVYGAKVPIVLTSRAEPEGAKLASIAQAVVVSARAA